MDIQLSDHFTYRKLIRFAFPSIIMMIFTSIYSVVDGFFVSNFAGKTAFAAVNFTFPVLGILGAVGFVFGTGGSAIIATTMGEDKPEEAKRQFSLFVWAAAIIGAFLAFAGFFVLRPILELFGAEGELLENCIFYGRINLIALPAFTLQYAFQSLFVTAGKPKLGLHVTVAAGVTNIVLDALFVGVCRLGLGGAAAATALGQCVGGIVPLIYFARENTSSLRLVKTSYDGRTLGRACTNGSSELMSSIAMSIVSMLFNYQLMKYAGENGVAAYGVMMYVGFVFVAIFIGFSVGTAPIISFHYGAGNHSELQGLRKQSMMIISVISVGMLILAFALARPFSKIFVGYNQELLEMTVQGFAVYSFSFLFSGISIWASGFFTALNNGGISALLSFTRSLLFETAAVMILPLIFGIKGIWLSVVIAEIFAAGLSMLFICLKKKKYHY
ncbi:MAG: MATE family efflux transporter [Eubacteriales bacterium]|nr:MATE family efflux transporter [Eubacteriales bacterium]